MTYPDDPETNQHLYESQRYDAPTEAEGTRSYPPTVDELTVAHPLERRSAAPQPHDQTTAPSRGRSKRWGPSTPTVLAGVLLIALSVVVAFVRLSNAGTDSVSPAAILVIIGGVLLVGGALMLLVGRQRTTPTTPRGH